MSNPPSRRLALILLAVLAATGCATKPPPEQRTPPSAAELDAMQPPASRPLEIPEPVQPVAPLSPLDDPNSPLYNKTIYFDYDTAEIPADSTELLRAHAGYIYGTPGVSVTLEGHTDERGTRDYNLALGDRRADAVQRFLVAEGVPAQKLRRLSFGEERPADPASNERAWALNRRVELVY